MGAGPIGAPVGNELVGRRSRVVHGEDPHAPPGVRIIPLHNESECDEGVLAHPNPRRWRVSLSLAKRER